MIPLMILAGLAVGVLPGRWALAGLLVAAGAWPLLIVATDSTYAGNVGWMLRSFALSAVNVAAGLVLMKRIVIPIAILSQSLAILKTERLRRQRP